MHRPGYREAIVWIAYNDDDCVTDLEQIQFQVTTVMIADLFQVKPERVARDILRKRTQRKDTPNA